MGLKPKFLGHESNTLTKKQPMPSVLGEDPFLHAVFLFTRVQRKLSLLFSFYRTAFRS